MERQLTFTEFLATAKIQGEVDGVLAAGLAHRDFPGTDDVNNLFAVSQHFIRNASSHPQEILEALVFAYQRWILNSLQQTAKSIERCIAANRVVFIEDARHRTSDAPLWSDLNNTLTHLTGNVQDFGVVSNYALLNRDLYQKLG